MTTLADRIAAWRLIEQPQSSWRRRSRSRMDIAIQDAKPTTFEQLLAAVDAAYPFGERAMHPYKAWRAERKLLKECLADPLPAPTDEDYGAVLAAIDMFELGDVDGARKLLDDQAPRRLNRECSVCGAKVGVACREQVGVEIEESIGTSIANKERKPMAVTLSRKRDKFVDLVVPHLARVMPERVNGPLFGGVA